MNKKFLTMKHVLSVVLLLTVMFTTLPNMVVLGADGYKEISKSGWTKYCNMEHPQEGSTGDKLFDGKTKETGGTAWQSGTTIGLGKYCGVKLPEAQSVNRLVFNTHSNNTPPLVGVYVTNDFVNWTRVGEFGTIGGEAKYVDVTVDFPTMKIIGMKLMIDEELTGGWWSAHELTLYYNPDIKAAAVESADLNGHSYEHEINLLTSLELVENKDVGEFGVDDYLSRAVFAEWMLNYAGIPVSEYNGDPVYLDVSPEHWAYNLVYTCYSAGIVQASNKDVRFRPDDNITYGEAMAMLVRLLGYSQIAEANGGYPSGYFAAATKAGLLKGISAGRDDEMTRAELAHLIFNSLDVKPMIITNISNNGYESNISDDTMLSRFEVIKERGVVRANEITMLNNPKPVATGQVMINDEIFKVGQTKAASMLGALVDFWYKEVDGRKTLIYVKAAETMDESIVIQAEDIASSSFSKIVYFDENTDKEKTLNISDECNFIFNGVANTYITVDDLMPDCGRLEAIDNDSDGKIDVLKIESYLTYVVMTASDFDKTIYDRYSKPNIVLKNIEEERVKIIDVETGANKKISSLRSGAVLTVAPDRMKTVNGERVIDNDNTTYITIYVSTQKVTGAIEKMVQKDGKTQYVINGTAYSLADTNIVEEQKNRLTTGKTYTFSLDYMGRIADFDQESGTNQYGILMGVREGKPLSDEITLRIFTQAGKVTLFKIQKKARLGEQQMSVNGIYTALSNFIASCTDKPSLVRYKADAGVIKSISVANNTAEVVLEEDREDSDVQLAYDGTYIFANGCFGNAFFSDSKTVGFGIVKDSNGNLRLNDETALRTRSATGGFSWNYGYKMFAYNLSNKYIPDVICVIESDTGSYNSEAAMTVFKELYSTYDIATGVTKQIVVGICNGATTEYTVAENSTYDFADLNVGDVGFCTTNSKGEVLTFNRVFNSTKDWDNSPAVNVDAGSVASSLRYAAGKVLKKDGGFLVVDVSKKTEDGSYDGSVIALFNGISSVCIIDDGELSVESVSEVSIGDNIFIRNCYGKPFDVVIYK